MRMERRTVMQLWVEYDYGRPNRVKSKTTY
jgi:hypothetical protein